MPSFDPDDFPSILYRDRVRETWIDYNGHMSEAYYVLVFGFATDALYDRVGFDAAWRGREGSSAYTVEAHVRYLHEIGGNEPLVVATRVLAVDSKRLRFFHTLRHGDGGDVLATEELLVLHVDTAAGRVTPFPEEIQTRLASLARRERERGWPAAAGRAITLDSEP